MNQLAIKKDNSPPIRQFVTFIQSSKFLGAVLAIVNYVIIFIMLMAAILPKQYSLKVGDILQYPISATRDVEDTLTTEELRQAARQNVSNIYRFDENITESVIVEVEQIFDQIEGARQLAQETFEDYKQELQKKQENQDEQEEEIIDQQIPDSSEPSPDEILTDQFIGEIKEDFPIMLSNDEILTCFMPLKMNWFN